MRDHPEKPSDSAPASPGRVALWLLCLAPLASCGLESPQARQQEIRQELELLDQAITQYALLNNAHPGSLYDLLNGTHPGTHVSRENLIDPFGNPYLYTPAGAGHPHQLSSYGPDGAPGGEGQDADIDLRSIRTRRTF